MKTIHFEFMTPPDVITLSDENIIQKGRGDFPMGSHSKYSARIIKPKSGKVYIKLTLPRLTKYNSLKITSYKNIVTGINELLSSMQKYFPWVTAQDLHLTRLDVFTNLTEESSAPHLMSRIKKVTQFGYMNFKCRKEDGVIFTYRGRDKGLKMKIRNQKLEHWFQIIDNPLDYDNKYRTSFEIQIVGKKNLQKFLMFSPVMFDSPVEKSITAANLTRYYMAARFLLRSLIKEALFNTYSLVENGDAVNVLKEFLRRVQQQSFSYAKHSMFISMAISAVAYNFKKSLVEASVRPGNKPESSTYNKQIDEYYREVRRILCSILDDLGLFNPIEAVQRYLHSFDIETAHFCEGKDDSLHFCGYRKSIEVDTDTISQTVATAAVYKTEQRKRKSGVLRDSFLADNPQVI